MSNRRIYELTTSDVFSLTKDAKLSEAIATLAVNNISSIIITNESVPVGILTERDIARASNTGVDTFTLPVSSVMSPNPVTVYENSDISVALDVMERNRIRRLVVIDKTGRLRGIVTQTDILKKLDEDLFKVHTAVESIMSTDLLNVSPDTTLKTTIEKIAEERKSCVIVVTGAAIKGIFTERDVVRHLYKQTPPDTHIRDICSRNIAYVSTDTILYDALKIMNERRIRHLVVIDSRQQLKGLVTQTDIVNMLHESIAKGIRDQAQRFKESLDILQTGFMELELNDDGTVLWINKHGATELGFGSPDSLIGTDISSLLLKPEQWKDFIKKAVGKEGVVSYIFKFKNRIIEGSFKISGLIASGLFKDITDRFAESESLRDERNRLENILKTLSEGLLIVGSDDIVKEINFSALEMFELKREEMVNEPYYSKKIIFIDEDGNAFGRETHPVSWVLKTYNPVLNLIAGIRRADGNIIWLKLTATPSFGADRKIREVVMVLTDITELYSLEKRYQKILDTAREGHWEVGLEGIIRRINPSLSALLGYRVEELIGKSIYDLVVDSDRHIFFEALEKRKHGISESYEITLLHKNGSRVYTIVSASPQKNSAGKVEGAFAFITDITAVKITQNMQHAIASFSKDITMALSENETYDIFRHYLLKTGDDRRKIDCIYLTGIDPESNTSMDVIRYCADGTPDYRFPGHDKCKSLIYSGTFAVNDILKEYACPYRPENEQAGSYYCTMINIGGSVSGVLHLFSHSTNFFDDRTIEMIESFISLLIPVISNMRLLELNKKLALIDPLTGLYNRRYFETFIEKQLALADRNEQPLSMVLLDIDNFKQFNDTYGHDAGDSALKTVSDAILKNIRLADIGVRYGGEEFMLVLPNTDKSTAFEVAERTRLVIQEMPIHISAEKDVRITISSGIATYAVDADNLELLIAKADNSLYNAKRTGKNKTCLA
ncbi:MAG: diguanylate cyclase [Nitrospirae bacterium]|nr:MAG: diguanylate cyclase [Nitrospirota bacterium]